jgi:hypothetical protein
MDEPTITADPRITTASPFEIWKDGYKDGAADVLTRYGIGPVQIEDEPQGSGAIFTLVSVICFACICYLVWYLASQPHIAEVSGG